MKNISLNIEDIFNIPTAEIFSPDKFRNVSSVSIDSRKVKKSSLFVAIKGKRFDGHDFVAEAVKNGASAIVINKTRLKDFDSIDVPIITVKNTVQALGSIANAWRKKIKAIVIGITGSSGKTSTKEILAALLSEKYKVNKTELNNNNHIGVPLTILSTNYKHDILVAEVGTNHFGEIEYSSKVLEPDFALITNIGNSHLEYLKNKNGVLKEKSALFDAAQKRSGTLFINSDDPLLRESSKNYKNKITFGFKGNPDVKGNIIGYTNDGRAKISIKTKNRIVKNDLPVYGEVNAQNYLASIAVATKLGITNSAIKKANSKISASKGRLSVIKLKSITLIDDTYNANPESTVAAIELLMRIKINSKKVLLLGDMYELGKNEIKFHKNLAGIINKNSVSEVYTIGKATQHLYNELKNSKIITKHFKSRAVLKRFIQQNNFNDSVILVKGSRGMRMEEFVKILKHKYSD